MSLFSAIEAGTAPRARTNLLQLHGDPAVILNKLARHKPGCTQVRAGVVEVPRQANEKHESYYPRVDQSIQDYIRQQLGLSDQTRVRYDRFGAGKDLHAVLYLTESGTSGDDLGAVVGSYQLNTDRVIQSLFKLLLKQSFLETANQHYEIDPVEFNAELYIGLMPWDTNKNGNRVFEALQYDLYFSPTQELCLTLKKTVMECSPVGDGSSRPVTETGMLMFDWGNKRYQRTAKKLDAKSYGQRQYMAFSSDSDTLKPHQRYANSINYHQADCLNRLERILEQLGLEYKKIEFAATHQVTNFLQELPHTDNPVWLLNTIDSPALDCEIGQALLGELVTLVGAERLLGPSELPSPDQLQVGNVNYLVVSQELENKDGGKSGSSIVEQDQDKGLTTFWKALEKQQRSADKPTSFDYYTEAKLHKFLSEQGIVCQGLNLEPKSLLNSKNLIEILRLDAKELAKKKGRGKELRLKLEKIVQELALKEAVFKHRQLSISDACFPATEVQLFYCRKTKGFNSKSKKGLAYIQVLDVTVACDCIRINSARRYDKQDMGEFNFSFPLLAQVVGKEGVSPFDAIRDGTFLMHDKTSKAWLNLYYSDRIPCIIGNSKFDNQQLHDEGVPPTRSSKVESAALPYYTVPTRNKQRYGIYIQDNGEAGAWFFVSGKNGPEQTIGRQNRVYNAVVFDKDGQRVPVLDHPLGRLFFGTFTFDIIKLRESAKKSILQKMVEIYLLN